MENREIFIFGALILAFWIFFHFNKNVKLKRRLWPVFVGIYAVGLFAILIGKGINGVPLLIISIIGIYLAKGHIKGTKFCDACGSTLFNHGANKHCSSCGGTLT